MIHGYDSVSACGGDLCGALAGVDPGALVAPWRALVVPRVSAVAPLRALVMPLRALVGVI